MELVDRDVKPPSTLEALSQVYSAGMIDISVSEIANHAQLNSGINHLPSTVTRTIVNDYFA